MLHLIPGGYLVHSSKFSLFCLLLSLDSYRIILDMLLRILFLFSSILAAPFEFVLFSCYLPSSLSSFVFAIFIGCLFVSSCRLLSSPLSLDPYPVLFLPFLPSTSRMPASTQAGPRQWDAFRCHCRREKILQRGPLPW